MRTPLAAAGAFLGALSVCLPAFVLAPPPARAEPAVVANPASVGAVRTAELAEAWRAGGEDDEIFFGSVAAIRTGPEGNVHVLDGQVSEVQVYAPDGEHLRTVFREGDGPGEIRRPSDMYLGRDGTVCALQDFPGRIIRVDAEGLPAGVIRYSRDAGGEQQMGVLNRGFATPDGMALVGIRMTFGGTITEQTYFLALCDAEGVERAALVEKSNPVDYSNFVMTEKGLDFVWSRVAVADDGTVFVAPERDEYAIRVFGPAGEHLRTITRACEPGKRDPAEVKNARQILEAIGAYYPRPPVSYETEDVNPAIAGMWVTRDGRLWVQTGDAHRDAPAGTWVVLDVFGPDGRLEEQVALPGAHDALQDALYVQPDGRIFVVTGALDAFLNQQAVAKDAAEESTPLEIICYDLGS